MFFLLPFIKKFYAGPGFKIFLYLLAFLLVMMGACSAFLFYSFPKNSGIIITTIVSLFVVGIFVSAFISYMINEDLRPTILKIKNMLEDEIQYSEKTFRHIHGNWTDFISAKDKRQNRIDEAKKETSQLSSTFKKNISDVTKQLNTIDSALKTQKDKIQDMSVSLAEISNNVKSVATHADTAVATSKNSEEDAKKGGEVASKIIRHMNKITKTVSKSASVIRELRKRSDEIVDIINVIDDIADQTDLLALNAAIEAARAGEQGRGFAVVADQIRSLAEKTTHATKEIAATLSSIQDKTSKAAESMEEGLKEIDIGAGFAVQAGVSLRKIVAATKRVTEMIYKIDKTAELQTDATLVSSQLIEKIFQGSDITTGENRSTVEFITLLEKQLDTLYNVMQNFLAQCCVSKNEENILAFGEYTNKEIEVRAHRLKKILKYLDELE